MTCQSDIAQTQETPLMRGGLICCVNSTIWRPKKCTDSQREHSQPEQKYAKISQKNSCPISYKNACVRSTSTSWLFSNMSNVQIPHFRSVFSCEASNLRGLGFLDTAFKRRRPRWKRAKSGSWKLPSHSKLDQKPSMSWTNCLSNQW